MTTDQEVGDSSSSGRATENLAAHGLLRSITKGQDMTTSVPQRVAYIVGIGAVLGASSSIAKRGVPSWESTVFRGINRQPDALEYLAWVPMQAGALAAPLVLGAITAIKGDRRRGLTVAVAGFAAWGRRRRQRRPLGEGGQRHTTRTFGCVSVPLTRASAFRLATRPWRRRSQQLYRRVKGRTPTSPSGHSL